MASFRKRLLRRLRRHRAPPAAPASPGRTRLDDGTVLERCVWVTATELHALTQNQQHPRLFIHWSTASEDCVHDLPDLRELHLFWAHHVDFLAICWDQSICQRPPQQTATAVDAWHRDYGLTWQSLVPAHNAGTAASLFGLQEVVLPQVLLYDSDENLIFHRIGPLAPGDRGQLALLLREGMLLAAERMKLIAFCQKFRSLNPAETMAQLRGRIVKL